MSKQRPDSIWGQLLQKMGYTRVVDKAPEVNQEVVEEAIEEAVETPSRIEIEAANEAYVEEHILPEPEQEIKTPEDFVEAASAGVDTFVAVVEELPDAEPTPKPEPDAILTNVEVKVVKPAKKKGGRPKKNASK